MIVIGADTHKSSHTLAAIDAATGRVVSSRTVAADEAGQLAAIRWARGLDAERVWAVEDCRHVSGRLEQALVGAGERVVRVAPKLMGASRSGERQPGKSDAIDAVAVARAALREGVETLPAAYLDERALEIRLLVDHRNGLVKERTREQNRLRWHLLELCPHLEAAIPSGALDRDCWLDRVARTLAKLPPTARRRLAREQVRRIRELTRAVKALERELAALVKAQRPQLLAESGCGVLTAATLIARTAGAERFATDGHFARQAGAAPIPASSGRRDRVRLNRGGDRQLNCALHRIAVTRARVDPATRAYLQRKQAEGKTRREALRCLKRHLARRIWKLLQATPHPGRTRMSVNAPFPVPCLT
jgi:transposase